MWRALFDQYPHGHYLLIFANILGDVKGKGSKRSVSFDPSFVMLGMVRKSMKILNQKSCQLIIGYNWLIYHGRWTHLDPATIPS